jgi:hypothetical protein
MLNTRSSKNNQNSNRKNSKYTTNASSNSTLDSKTVADAHNLVSNLSQIKLDQYFWIRKSSLVLVGFQLPNNNKVKI